MITLDEFAFDVPLYFKVLDTDDNGITYMGLFQFLLHGFEDITM